MQSIRPRIVIAGSHGLIGTSLCQYLRAAGADVLQLVRTKVTDPSRELYWDYQEQTIDEQQLEGCTAVIHLAGENLADGRWTPARKERLLASRVRSTQFLSQTIAELSAPPPVFLAASAVGYYGDRDGEVLAEHGGLGEGFLTDLCAAWEAATGGARRAGIRTLNLRFGMVLSPTGGALARMLPLFRLGLGGPLGNGQQYVSWIALADAVRAVTFALTCDALAGPVNIVAPTPVTNAAFTRALASAVARPAVMPAPAWALRLAFGELADAILLSSTRAVPEKLLRQGFAFDFPELAPTLAKLLKPR